MLLRFRSIRFLGPALCVLITFGAIGGCSSADYKADADEEVYKIIDTKWNESFGGKANYKTGDVAPLPDDIRPEDLLPLSRMLPLVEAVAIATANNRNYQTQKESLYLAALDLTLQRHRFTQQWFGTIDADYIRDSDDETISYDAELGFDQLLADGAAISISIANDWLRFLTGSPRTSLGSVLSATVAQPLLRGRGRKIAQESLTQAERNALYQIRSFNRFRKTFVVSIVNDYYRILQQMDVVTNAENNYQRRLESKERLEMEAEAGSRDIFEVDQAEQDVLRAQDSHVRAQQRYEQLLDAFKIRLALPTDRQIELDPDELEALRKADITEPDYTLEQAVETALLQRLDLANSADRVDDARRKTVVAADNLGAELNLVGRMGVGSAGKTNFTNLQFQNGTYGLGLEADLPLDRKTERNAYRRTLIALEQQQREYDNDADEVKLDIRQAYRDLQEAAERHRIQKNSLDLANKRVASTTLLLEAGRLTIRDLLESQDALVEAQDNVTSALIDHAIAKLNFFRDVGILQIRPDGMWEQ